MTVTLAFSEGIQNFPYLPPSFTLHHEGLRFLIFAYFRSVCPIPLSPALSRVILSPHLSNLTLDAPVFRLVMTSALRTLLRPSTSLLRTQLAIPASSSSRFSSIRFASTSASPRFPSYQRGR